MSSDDIYGEEELEPLVKPKGKKSAQSLEPGSPDEGDDVDRVLAFADLSDLGNAKRLITRFGEDLIHVENIGWFAWDGVRWVHDSGQSGALKLAHKVAQAIVGEAKALKDKPGKHSEDRVGKLFAWAVQSGNQGRSHGMLASAAPYLARKVDDLDSNAFLVATPAETIRLGATCEPISSNREYLITRSLGVPFKAGADCARFQKFLERILPSEDMRDFLQRILGYCLTGSTREHKLFILYGTGRNGKSTLVNVIRHVMGEYAASCPVQTFLAKRDGNSGSEASPDMARLPGSRFVTAAEPPEGARLDESRVKEMTGGDPMTVRHLNQGFFEFRPNFKAIISTNHRPTIRGTDHGIWSRILLVPFTVQIPDEEIDRDLERKLIEEGPGILQWMLDGCEAWAAGGLQPPAAAIAAVESYRADEDPVGEFLKAACDQFPLDYVNPSTGKPWETSQKRLRERYMEWCKDEGLDALSARAFGSKLTGRGVQRRKSNGLTFYQGITVKGDPLDGQGGSQ